MPLCGGKEKSVKTFFGVVIVARIVGYRLEPKVSSLPSFKGRVANNRNSP